MCQAIVCSGLSRSPLEKPAMLGCRRPLQRICERKGGLLVCWMKIHFGGDVYRLLLALTTTICCATTMMRLGVVSRGSGRVSALSLTRHRPVANTRRLGFLSSSSSSTVQVLPISSKTTSSNGAQHRLFASVSPAAATAEEESTVEEKAPTTPQSDGLFHPDQFENGTIPYPTSLSPSSIAEFKKCPQSFLFQYLYKLRQPTNPALAKGSMCHAALEQVFDLAPENRTLDVLQNLLRREWAAQRETKTYCELFANDDQTDEVTWGRSALELLANYWQHEDPAAVPRPNPVQREVWVRSNLTVHAPAGVTGYTVATTAGTNGDAADYDEQGTFLVRGIVDRLDMVQQQHNNNNEDRIVLRLIDYKTGKAPDLKYSRACNERIQAEAFQQLLIYALLLREKQRESTLPLRYLRLFYLTNKVHRAQTMDFDMGATAEERDRLLQSVHADLSQVWLQIMELVSRQVPMAWKGCDRSFCYCHACRERFVPGTVWEPPSQQPHLTA